MDEIAKISKAIAGALAGGIGGIGTAAIVVPAGVAMPWWGYVLTAVLNAALGFVLVYGAPKNAPPS